MNKYSTDICMFTREAYPSWLQGLLPEGIAAGKVGGAGSAHLFGFAGKVCISRPLERGTTSLPDFTAAQPL